MGEVASARRRPESQFASASRGPASLLLVKGGGGIWCLSELTKRGVSLLERSNRAVSNRAVQLSSSSQVHPARHLRKDGAVISWARARRARGVPFFRFFMTLTAVGDTPRFNCPLFELVRDFTTRFD